MVNKNDRNLIEKALINFIVRVADGKQPVTQKSQCCRRSLKH